jgi:thymidylate synthase
MIYKEANQSRALYIPWLQQLQDFGEDVEVRGAKTKEFLNAVTVVKEPWHHCILIPSRRWNPWLALSEALWILAGRDDVAALQPYNSHIIDYSDDGKYLYGAYGNRIYNQIDDVILRLKKDTSDRRAVLQIWRSGAEEIYKGSEVWSTSKHDLTTNSKDPPCNNMVYFKLRQNKLHMTVINRSNDLHFGLMAVNLPTFGILQSYIAARLGVEMGTQTHFSNSLHIYTNEPRAKAITDRMLYVETEDMPVYPEHDLAFTDLTEFTGGHRNFATWCSMALDGKVLGVTDKNGLQFLGFAMEFLKLYRDRPWKDISNNSWQEILLPWKYRFTDWIVAGEMFLKRPLVSGDKLVKSNAIWD